jgi:hypothetical protein
MSGVEEFLKSVAGVSGSVAGVSGSVAGVSGLDQSREVLSIEQQRDLIDQISPIPDLKIGDIVKWKSKEFVYAKFPLFGEEVVVCDVFEPHRSIGNKQSHKDDFAIVVKLNGEIKEFTLDSRYFVRA